MPNVTNSMPPRNLFHLRVKPTDEDIYYGSLKALVDNTERVTMGISIHTLYRYEWESHNMRYENDSIIIKKGILVTTKQNAQ